MRGPCRPVSDRDGDGAIDDGLVVNPLRVRRRFVTHHRDENRVERSQIGVFEAVPALWEVFVDRTAEHQREALVVVGRIRTHLYARQLQFDSSTVMFDQKNRPFVYLDGRQRRYRSDVFHSYDIISRRDNLFCVFDEGAHDGSDTFLPSCQLRPKSVSLDAVHRTSCSDR